MKKKRHDELKQAAVPMHLLLSPFLKSSNKNLARHYHWVAILERLQGRKETALYKREPEDMVSILSR
jgi:hypothetical protein